MMPVDKGMPIPVPTSKYPQRVQAYGETAPIP